MENEEALEHLLKIEAEAAVFVNGAMSEADHLIAENEKHNRASFDEKYHAEVEKLEAEFNRENVKIKEQYKKAMEVYHESLSGLSPNMGKFTLLFDELISGEG